MPADRVVLCGGAPDAALPFADKNPLRLNAPDAARNVRLDITDVRAAGRDVPPAFLDLLDLAAYVYVADQATTRGGAGVGNLGEKWRRRLFYRVPVREPDLWTSPPVLAALAAALGFPTDDEHHFEFVPWAADRRDGQQYIQFGADADGGNVDEVVMFSGGLDSLAGAVQEVVTDRRRALLVTHRSNPKDAQRHAALLCRLGEHAGGRVPNAVVGANKRKALNREFTQRSRSFLYAALGATLAVLTGRDRFRFYENGVISLNLPPLEQVVGARASRTTHPRTLAGFGQLVTALAGRPFTVENPFQWLTKADVVRRIVDAGCADLIGLATSCAHTWERTREHTHCGRCSQCIDRRFGVLAAGAADHDPTAAYGVDLLTGPRPADQSRVMALAYVGLAKRLARLDEAGFLGEFGAAARALRHCGMPTDEAAARMLALLRRHGEQVTGALADGIARHSREMVRRELPPDCLMQLALDSGAADPVAGGEPGPPPSPPPLPPPIQLAADAPYVLRRQGDVWVVRYPGHREFVLLPKKGVSYLRELFVTPGRRISAVELAYRTENLPDRVRVGRGDEVMDADTREACRMRMAELADDITAAVAAGDDDAAERARREFNTIGAYVTQSTGLSGRSRRMNDDLNKFRAKVGNALRRTLNDIKKYCPPLYAHLRKHLKVGQCNCYSPDEPVRWVTE